MSDNVHSRDDSARWDSVVLAGSEAGDRAADRLTWSTPEPLVVDDVRLIAPGELHGAEAGAGVEAGRAGGPAQLQADTAATSGGWRPAAAAAGPDPGGEGRLLQEQVALLSRAVAELRPEPGRQRHEHAG